MPKEEDRRVALGKIGWSCTRNLPIAVEAAGDLLSGDPRSKLLSHRVAEWSVVDPAAALDWVKERRDPEDWHGALTD